MGRKIKFIILFCVLVLLINHPYAHAFEGRSIKKVLDNGLTIIVSEMPGNPFVSVYGLVKTGSATEEKYLGAGISHFVEHMLFKGTEKRGVGEVAQAIQAVGGDINASTSLDYTIYTVDVPAEHFDLGLDVLSDILMHSVFDPEETKKEQEVIKGEIRLHNDNPESQLSQATFQNIYKLHPYRHPIIGYESLFAQLTHKELADYYHERYVPNNMIISVAGNVRIDEVLPKIEAAFQHYPRSYEMNRDFAQEPKQNTMRRSEMEYATDFLHLSLAFPSVRLIDHDLFALDVLAAILGQGESSRLNKAVYREKRLVKSITASNFTPIDQGAFEVEALLEEKNTEETITAVMEEIVKIQKKGVTEEELAKAKKNVQVNYIQGRQTTGGIAYNQALDEAFTGDYLFSNKYVSGIEQVTFKDIERVAEIYLKKDHLSVTIVKPMNQKKEPEKKSEEKKIEIEKHVFENGLTLLLHEDKTLPLVSMRLMLQGGLRKETAGNNGITRLLTQAWEAGTQNKNAVQLAEYIERNGLTLQTIAGNNSYGLYLEFLSSDLDKAMNLFEELIKAPTFPQEELDRIKDRLRASLSRKKDDIFSFSKQKLMEKLFPHHSLSLDLDGTFESLIKLTRQDVLNYYQELTQPSNMVIAVYGDIDKAKILSEMEKRFGHLLNKKPDLKENVPASLEGIKRFELTLDKKQAMVMFGFQGEGIKGQDRYGLEVLVAILGSSFNGWLFTNIRDKHGYAYTLGGYYVPTIDAGYIIFFVQTDPDHIKQVEELLWLQLREIGEKGVTDKELGEIKDYLKGSQKGDLQTKGALTMTTALDELYGLGYDHYTYYDEKINAVTPVQIQQLAKKYLNLERCIILITHPPDKGQEKVLLEK